MDKHEVAKILDEIGVLLEFTNENPFKIRAYHNAARAIENLNEDVEVVVKEKRLEEIEGVGEGIAEKVTTLVQKGRLPFFEKLKKSVPSGLLELVEVPGLGSKKVKVLFEKLKVKNKKELIAACKAGKVAKLSGFSAQTEEAILTGLAKIQMYRKRRLWIEAEQLAWPIYEGLKKVTGVKKVEIAGSLRRKLETVGDLDFLVSASRPNSVIDWFVKQKWVKSVVAKGEQKASVRLKNEVQADLRIIPEKEFASALLYFTGSKEHNIKLRARAKKKGMTLNEYGLDGARKSEKEIYKALGLHYIPPELREDMGEIEFAAKKKIPPLIEEKDIRGVFHCHTTDSDGHNTLEEMVRGAQKRGLTYIGISDHSKSSFQANGLSEDRLYEQIEKIKKLNKKQKVRIFAGIECDILPTGKLDFPDSVLKELDFVIVSIHSSFKKNEKEMTKRLVKAIENPYTTMVAHPTGRLLLKRESYPISMPKIIDAAIANGKIIELNSHPMRQDMDWRLWHSAAKKGLMCSINPDAHCVDDLDYVFTGVHLARKGWLQKKDVLNAQTIEKVKKILTS